MPTPMPRTRFLLLLTLLAVVVAIALPLPRAVASTPYEQWRFRTSDVCVETHGWRFWPTVEAARHWDAAPDVHIYAWWDCSSRPRNQVVVLRAYWDANVEACAKAGSNGYDWVYSGGQWTWAPRAMVIWLNIAPQAKAGCYAIPEQRAHVISHELGHALGLAHRVDSPEDPSVMGNWKYEWPTYRDLIYIEGRYPW